MKVDETLDHPSVAAPPRLGINDVARKAGVSPVTVSRAMNSPGVVSEATRIKIETAMRDLGYVPNLMARGLAQGSSKMVACFVPTLVSSIFADTIQGLSDGLREAGYSVFVGSTEYNTDLEDRLIEAALGRRADGIVLTGTARSARMRKLLSNAAIPVVETWNLIKRPVDMVVGFSNFEASKDMTRHLISAGYQHIAYVGRPPGVNDRADARRNGFIAGLQESGRQIDPATMLDADTTMNAGAEAVRRIRSTNPSVDAIVFSSDNLAIGAWFACQEQGWRVPQDVAIAGFGNIDLASSIPGGLTTINVRSYDIGQTAADMLMSCWREKKRKRRIIDIGYELICRGST